MEESEKHGGILEESRMSCGGVMEEPRRSYGGVVEESQKSRKGCMDECWSNTGGDMEESSSYPGGAVEESWKRSVKLSWLIVLSMNRASLVRSLTKPFVKLLYSVFVWWDGHTAL